MNPDFDLASRSHSFLKQDLLCSLEYLKDRATYGSNQATGASGGFTCFSLAVRVSWSTPIPTRTRRGWWCVVASPMLILEILRFLSSLALILGYS